jgi:hypothetical protein
MGLSLVSYLTNNLALAVLNFIASLILFLTRPRDWAILLHHTGRLEIFLKMVTTRPTPI